MYHRIAPEGSAQTAHYRLDPQRFEEQLRYLRDAGYRTISVEAWGAALHTRRALPGRLISITFDDGYRDFLTYAWPLLKQYGFSAQVFLVAGAVGDTNHWDAAFGEQVPLLNWQEIQALQNEGVVFGSHALSHQALIGLSPEDMTRELAHSRMVLEQKLGVHVKDIAYPHGLTDRVVEHLASGCGYEYGVTCDSRLAELTDRPLALPRLEITGHDTFQDFVKKVSGA